MGRLGLPVTERLWRSGDAMHFQITHNSVREASGPVQWKSDVLATYEKTKLRYEMHGNRAEATERHKVSCVLGVFDLLEQIVCISLLDSRSSVLTSTSTCGAEALRSNSWDVED